MKHEFPALLAFDWYEDGTVILRFPLSNDPPQIIENPTGRPLKELLKASSPQVRKPTYKQLACKRCGSTWTPRKKQPPVQCPKCKSPYWNKQRVYPKE